MSSRTENGELLPIERGVSLIVRRAKVPAHAFFQVAGLGEIADCAVDHVQPLRAALADSRRVDIRGFDPLRDPVAVGLAMSAKRKGLDRVTVVSFGDGATNTGSFHEAANMAALWDLPLVFVCQNNLYAEMTPTSDTMKLEHVADRAAGYGMPGVRVDGNDPRAVKSVLDEALRRARAGGGPTFIECVTFRFRGHYFGDRMPYIPREQLAAAMEADPVPKFRAHLVEAGLCDEAELGGIDSDAVATVEAALQTVMAADSPSVDELDRDVYATPIKFPV